MIKQREFKIIIFTLLALLFFLSAKGKINYIQVENNYFSIVDLDTLSPSLKLDEKSVKNFFTLKDSTPLFGSKQVLSLKHDIIFDSFDPEAVIQQNIKQLLTENNYAALGELLRNAGINEGLGEVAKIKIRELTENNHASFWHVWRADIILNNGSVLETVCRVLKPNNGLLELREQELADVLKSHKIFQGKKIIPELFLYRNFQGEHIIFAEYIANSPALADYKQINSDAQKRAKIEMLIAEQVLKIWFNSAFSKEERFIFADGHNWERGNVRFYKDGQGKIKAKIVDVGAHIKVYYFRTVIEMLVDSGFKIENLKKGSRRGISALKSLVNQNEAELRKAGNLAARLLEQSI